jgi:hypothetical protein
MLVVGATSTEGEQKVLSLGGDYTYRGKTYALPKDWEVGALVVHLRAERTSGLAPPPRVQDFCLGGPVGRFDTCATGTLIFRTDLSLDARGEVPANAEPQDGELVLIFNLPLERSMPRFLQIPGSNQAVYLGDWLG